MRACPRRQAVRSWAATTSLRPRPVGKKRPGTQSRCCETKGRTCREPITASLAQTFRESLVNKSAPPRTLSAKSGNERRSVPGPERSPLIATPRKASPLLPYATRAWRVPTVEVRPANPIACGAGLAGIQSSARSRRSSMRSHSGRSARPQGSRSQPARASGPVRRSRIRGIGRRSWRCSAEGNAAKHETRLQ